MEMGALRSSQSFEAEVEEFRMQILQQQQQHHQKGSAFVKKKQQQQPKRESRLHGDVEEDEGETVCVTSGTSFLGFAIANRLLSRGYSVRLLLHTQGIFQFQRHKISDPILDFRNGPIQIADKFVTSAPHIQF